MDAKTKRIATYVDKITANRNKLVKDTIGSIEHQIDSSTSFVVEATTKGDYTQDQLDEITEYFKTGNSGRTIVTHSFSSKYLVTWRLIFNPNKTPELDVAAGLTETVVRYLAPISYWIKTHAKKIDVYEDSFLDAIAQKAIQVSQRQRIPLLTLFYRLETETRSADELQKDDMYVQQLTLFTLSKKLSEMKKPYSEEDRKFCRDLIKSFIFMTDDNQPFVSNREHLAHLVEYIGYDVFGCTTLNHVIGLLAAEVAAAAKMAAEEKKKQQPKAGAPPRHSILVSHPPAVPVLQESALATDMLETHQGTNTASPQQTMDALFAVYEKYASDTDLTHGQRMEMMAAALTVALCLKKKKADTTEQETPKPSESSETDDEWVDEPSDSMDQMMEEVVELVHKKMGIKSTDADRKELVQSAKILALHTA